MRVIGTGLSGLVGTRVVDLLTPRYSFQNLSLETGTDITDSDSLFDRIAFSEAPWVFHFAAYTNVDQAEIERIHGRKGAPWLVNVEATAVIANACRETGKRLLYVSTDYVFDGTGESYSEEDEPSPSGWYGITKFEGEKVVSGLGDPGLVIRIANPYSAISAGKADFVHKIIQRLKDGLEVKAPFDQTFVPTFIDDIAQAIDHLVQSQARGIFHVVGSDCMSPLEAARSIASEFALDQSLISGMPFSEYFRDKAPRPLHACMKNAKITESGIYMRTFAEGLHDVRDQLERI